MYIIRILQYLYVDTFMCVHIYIYMYAYIYIYIYMYIYMYIFIIHLMYIHKQHKQQTNKTLLKINMKKKKQHKDTEYSNQQVNQ